jgi:O-antigen/teichoic acid export membrane protein
MIVKIYLLLVLISIPAFIGIILITEHLVKIATTNKFRKWWNNNVVDLDDKYTK